jgi:hypothetical protein
MNNSFRRDHGMSKYAFRQLLDIISPILMSQTPTNSTHLPPNIKLSTFLHFMRTNSFQRSVASQKSLQISQASACDAINDIAHILASKQQEFVKFPNKDEGQRIAQEIYNEFGFPPVVCGIIDGTHVRISKPLIKEPPPERFYNRKGFFSLNCMCVVDHEGKFTYFTARHCGSAHDAKAFGQSHLRSKLLDQFDQKTPLALIGDEGYGCEDILLVPVRQRQLDAENNPAFKNQMLSYNKGLRSVRIKVTI